MTIFSKVFWRYAGERAVKSFAQAVGGALVGGTAATVAGTDWKVILITALATAGLSVITSITAFTGPSTPAPQSDSAPVPADPNAPSVQ